jgi:hypothetical protein
MWINYLVILQMMHIHTDTLAAVETTQMLKLFLMFRRWQENNKWFKIALSFILPLTPALCSTAPYDLKLQDERASHSSH